MVPMGKPKPGFEKRFLELFEMLTQDKIPKPSFWDSLKGKKLPTEDDLLKEWSDIQIQSYETIKAPRVGYDQEANDWIREKYSESDKTITETEFLIKHDGIYIIELAKEIDGVPVYNASHQDENAFRGQFLDNCVDLIGTDLVDEAWETKLADDTLDYGNRLLIVADKIANDNNLGYLKDQRDPPDFEENSIECKLHIIYSLAKWLIFYGKNGHGYEADF